MYVNRWCNFRRQKCDRRKSREVSKLQILHNLNMAHVKCKNNVMPEKAEGTVTITKSRKNT
jgi:hypothetical protein